VETVGSDLLERFAENLPGGALHFAIDASGRQSCGFLNDGCRDLYGLPPGSGPVAPERLWAMVDADDAGKMQRRIAQSAETLCRWEHRFRIIDAQGRRKYLLGRGTPRRLSDGGTEWLTFLFDVTAQVRAEAEVRSVSYRLSMVSEAIPDGFALFDRDERLVICNGRFRYVYDLDPEPDLRGMTYETLLRHAARNGLFPAAEGREEAWVAGRLASFRTADAAPEDAYAGARWFRILDRPTADGGRVAFRIETTHTRDREARLERAALTDSLTGLLNRRGLSRRLPELAQGIEAGQRIALCHLDLDKFKAINDAAGHEAGDRVLLDVAGRLSRIRPTGATVARLGGDEFLVAMPTRNSDADVVDAAEKMRLAVGSPVAHGDRQFQIGASFGVAIWDPRGARSLEQCLLDADTALINGKAAGRNRTILFCEEMRCEAERDARLASEIREGLRGGEFVCFLQPQLDLEANRVYGVEALARWRRQDGAILPAGAFVPVARETGLVTEIDRCVLIEALASLWNIRSAHEAETRVSINLASERLRDPNILEDLLDPLFQSGLGTDCVTLEIQESTLLDDRSDVIAANIAALADAGFRIELDDFGTGHTALTSLRRFPVHQIKIDRSLVTGIDSEPASRAIVDAISRLAAQLGIGVIAEGVETHAELAALRGLGIARVQGNLISPPVSPHDLCQWLERRGAGGGAAESA
jgi:diguanylate cyclase (GGDEF)-like protein